MRRVSTILFSIAVVCGTLLLAGAMFAVPRDAVSQDVADHPIVGSWILDTDPESDEPPSLATFSAGGTYIEVDPDGSVGTGVWESTGDTTAILTFSFIDDEGMGTVRGIGEVAADGQSFTATYTIEFSNPLTGESFGEYGPGTATATRVVAEAPGTPDGSFEDFFAQFEGTPEASPAP